MRKWVLFVVLCVCVMVGGIQQAWIPSGLHNNPKNNLQPSTNYSLFIEDIAISSFDSQGKPESVITTPRIYQQQGMNEYSLVSPSLEVRHENAFWQARANRGTSSLSLDKLQLHGDVLMKEQSQNITINSNSIFFDKATNTVSTEDNIEINTEKSSSIARGMTLDIDNETIHFPARVKTRYEADPD